MRLKRFLAKHGVPGFEPILVYQMAKVGSSTVFDALIAQRLPVFQLHRMNREHLERMRARRASLGWHLSPLPFHDVIGPQLRDRIIARGRPVKVITLVREPIARNFSSYFEHLDSIWNRRNAHESVPMEELHRGFIERFPHDEPLTWFDDELRPVLGIDVYEHPFPACGHVRINNLLVLKNELEEDVKCAAVADFLGLDTLELSPSNVTERKAKGVVYRQFISTIRLDPALVEQMLSARYTRHFYSEAEIEVMRTRYAVPPE